MVCSCQWGAHPPSKITDLTDSISWLVSAFLLSLLPTMSTYSPRQSLCIAQRRVLWLITDGGRHEKEEQQPPPPRRKSRGEREMPGKNFRDGILLEFLGHWTQGRVSSEKTRHKNRRAAAKPHPPIACKSVKSGWRDWQRRSPERILRQRWWSDEFPSKNDMIEQRKTRSRGTRRNRRRTKHGQGRGWIRKRKNERVENKTWVPKKETNKIRPNDEKGNKRLRREIGCVWTVKKARYED